MLASTSRSASRQASRLFPLARRNIQTSTVLRTEHPGRNEGRTATSGGWANRERGEEERFGREQNQKAIEALRKKLDEQKRAAEKLENDLNALEAEHKKSGN